MESEPVTLVLNSIGTGYRCENIFRHVSEVRGSGTLLSKVLIFEAIVLLRSVVTL